MDQVEVLETLKDANDYLSRLKDINIELEYAERQIQNSSQESEKNIELAFSSLIAAISNTLTLRRDKLLEKTRKIRDKGLAPLVDCRKIVLQKLENTTQFINLGNDLLNVSPNDKERSEELIKRSSRLGSLPAIPALNEVPSISFQYDLSSKKSMLDMCNGFGVVSRIAPVQIYGLLEKPGAILVDWQMIDTKDRGIDVQEFRLQKAFGNVISDAYLETNYHDCYTGIDNRYLVKGLILNQEYTFRICCKFEGRSEWSPWSLPQIGSTSIQSFCWKSDKDFTLADENRIAKPSRDLTSMLFSSALRFEPGHSVEFLFLECDEKLDGTYVGLFPSNTLNSSQITTSNSVSVEANGCIYGSGSKKSTQLPQVHIGAKISFTCDVKDEFKYRVNIDANGKRVTYDWSVDNEEIYFGACFNSSRWKIMVE